MYNAPLSKICGPVVARESQISKHWSKICLLISTFSHISVTSHLQELQWSQKYKEHCTGFSMKDATRGQITLNFIRQIPSSFILGRSRVGTKNFCIHN